MESQHWQCVSDDCTILAFSTEQMQIGCCCPRCRNWCIPCTLDFRVLAGIAGFLAREPQEYLE